ncbi:septum site-determining protein MinC [Acetobacter sacchari]|uniref:Probable septum site-determining protein MinC n=1 Tax=Acetobacter sacchari TaxID=2661687 RepID=A0ABS3LTU3_9PROT|nr:septum site-determining protein MinC [Acetobacter sacchari]
MPPSSDAASSSASTAAPLRIRAGGRSFLALVLTPEAPLDGWLIALDRQIERSAGFFAGKPIILDLSLAPADDPGLPSFLPALQERGVRVIGIEGADRSESAFAGWDWPEGFIGGRDSAAVDVPDETEEQPPALPPGALVIEQPVRSGQQIVWPEGDVVILGSVASGAEISAGGSIHVYGALRGRAIAGIVGRPDARVFARVMQAELVAIDGFYSVADEFDPELVGKPAQALLEGESLILRPLP